MASTGKPKVKIGARGAVAAGTLVDVKCKVNHPMESGLRKNPDGSAIPAHHITDIEVEYQGKTVMKGAWTGAVSKNPYFQFKLQATATGEVKVTWKDNMGESWSASDTVTVG